MMSARALREESACGRVCRARVTRLTGRVTRSIRRDFWPTAAAKTSGRRRDNDVNRRRRSNLIPWDGDAHVARGNRRAARVPMQNKSDDNSFKKRDRYALGRPAFFFFFFFVNPS